MQLAPKTLAAALILLAASPLVVIADPPDHAPAHGWRKKHERDYVGYTGDHWQQDYEISSGRCNRQTIATVVGGVVGGAVANRVADGDNRAVATIIGAAIGAWIGNKVGRELDEADRACFGHAIEIGKTGRRVVWTNESTNVRYELSPGAGRRRGETQCREFTLVAVGHGQKDSRSGLACQAKPGVWDIQ